MKKIILSLLLIGFLAVPVIGLAQFEGPPRVATTSEEVFLTINGMISYLFWILIFGAALVVAIAAFNFLTSAGDPDKTKKARDYVTYAMIAVIVGFLAKGIIALVARMLQISIPYW